MGLSLSQELRGKITGIGSPTEAFLHPFQIKNHLFPHRE